MKAIILAAGLGTRMGAIGMQIPKCLLEINGKPILDHQIELLRNKNINDITIIIGAKGHCWTQENYEKIKKRAERTLINFENISQKRNFSLSVGIKDINSGPLLVFDGDLFFNEHLLDAMLGADGDIALLARDSKDINDSKNKIEVKGNKVLSMGPDVSSYPWKINAGFAKVSNNIFPEFKKTLFEPIYLESSFSVLIDHLCKSNDISIVLQNSGWTNVNKFNEIDISDQKLITNHFKKKIIITGVSGLLGQKLFSALKNKYSTIGCCFKKTHPNAYNIDIRRIDQVYRLFQAEKADIVIHTAAVVDPDLCEKDKKTAWDTNVEGTRNIAMACMEYNAKLVYVSSDYVFDGSIAEYSEDSPPCPINYYGSTKYEAEKLIRNLMTDYIIIRPTLMFGYNDETDKPTFVSQVVSRLKNNEEVLADNKMIKYPVLIDKVALCIKTLIEQNKRGIFHISGTEGITRLNWAKEIARIHNLPEEKIFEQNYRKESKRPLNVKLRMQKVESLGIKPQSLEKSLIITKQQRECIFRLMYSIHPDMEIIKEDISNFRISLGKILAEKCPIEADIVVPIPESGIMPATGYSQESKIPLFYGLINNQDIERTLYEPDQLNRSYKISKKIIPVNSIFEGKRVVLIDEAIITGITIKIVIDMIKKAKAKEIHIRIPSPPFIFPCDAKKHPAGDLIARKYDIGNDGEERLFNIEMELKKEFGVNSLKFLKLPSLVKALRNHNQERCIKCFFNEDKKKL